MVLFLRVPRSSFLTPVLCVFDLLHLLHIENGKKGFFFCLFLFELIFAPSVSGRAVVSAP